MLRHAERRTQNASVLERRWPNFRTQIQNAETTAEGFPERNPSHSKRTFRTQSGDWVNCRSKMEGKSSLFQEPKTQLRIRNKTSPRTSQRMGGQSPDGRAKPNYSTACICVHTHVCSQCTHI